MIERCSRKLGIVLSATAVVAFLAAGASAKIEKPLPTKGAGWSAPAPAPRGGPCCDSESPALCDGDANGDGVVDPLDAGFVLSRFGEDAASNCTADVNCDGVIDPLDSGYVLARFGQCDAVPECQQACSAGVANDECAGAEALACGGSATVDNTSATNNASDPLYSCKAGGADVGAGSVWYSFVATDSSADVSTCNSTGSPDTIIALYDGSCGALVELACNDDAGCGPSDFNSFLTVTGLTVGNTYLMQVSAWDESALGEITIDLTCPSPSVGACCTGGTGCDEKVTALQCQGGGGAYQGDGSFCSGSCSSPANDDCAGASEIFDGSTPFNNTDATDDGPVDCAADTGHQDIWFTHVITGAQVGALRVSLCQDTDYDSTLSVYDGGTCLGEVLGCSDDSCDVGGGPSEVVVALVPGTVSVGDTVMIRVGGWNNLGGQASPSGMGTITIDYVTGGDCCVAHGPPGCDVIDVPGEDPAEIEACVCAIDPSCCITTWDSACVVSVEGSCGVDCPLCPSIGTNDECECAAAVECGNVYTEEVSNFTSNDNDWDSDCEITGDSTDCPIDGGGPFGKDASWWYVLTTGPAQTSLHLTMCDTPNVPLHDTVMTIFTAGSTCDGLAELACDEDFCACGGPGDFGSPDLCTPVDPSTTYYILIDHYSGGCNGPGCLYALEISCDDGCVDH